MRISWKAVLWVVGILLMGLSIYLYYEKGRTKLSVHDILKEHLQTRFEEVPTGGHQLLLIRDRIVTTDYLQLGADPKNLAYDYVNFSLLKDDEAAIHSEVSDKIVYTDYHVKKATKDVVKHKIGWLVESPKGHSRGFRFLKWKKNRAQFDKILTCYRPFLEQGEPFVFAPVSHTFADLSVDIEDLIENKKQTVSIIASEKNKLVGHKLRHKVVKRFGDKIDSVVGRGYKPIEKTSEGLKQFKYSIVIENRKQDFYFTEKIVDCIMCGAVPIYWGCPSIDRFFNSEGIITFDNLDELEGILKNLSETDYNKRLNAVRENYRIAAQCYLNQGMYLKKELMRKSEVARN